jgi:hypothetical protein
MTTYTEPAERRTAVPITPEARSDRGEAWQGTGYWRDRVRWGPIWAGLLSAISLFLLLSAVAVAIGAQVIQGGAAAEQAGLGGAIVSGIIALLAFLAGGFIASRSASVMGRGYGALNGFLVWALGVMLILALAAFGLGSLFGASGDLFAQYRSLGSPTPDANVDPNQVAEGIRNSSLGALVGMLLPAAAATLGGWLGAREPVVGQAG